MQKKLKTKPGRFEFGDILAAMQAIKAAVDLEIIVYPYLICVVLARYAKDMCPLYQATVV